LTLLAPPQPTAAAEAAMTIEPKIKTLFRMAPLQRYMHAQLFPSFDMQPVRDAMLQESIHRNWANSR